MWHWSFSLSGSEDRDRRLCRGMSISGDTGAFELSWHPSRKINLYYIPFHFGNRYFNSSVATDEFRSGPSLSIIPSAFSFARCFSTAFAVTPISACQLAIFRKKGDDFLPTFYYFLPTLHPPKFTQDATSRRYSLIGPFLGRLWNTWPKGLSFALRLPLHHHFSESTTETGSMLSKSF